MATNKTQATEASVPDYLAAIDDEVRRRDCEALAKLLSKATKEPPRMWGAAIVGFGTIHYRYESGREGDTCLVGFSSCKGDISIYGLGSAPGRERLLARLGRHREGKGCLYLRALGDVDAKVLEQLVVGAVSAKRRGSRSTATPSSSRRPSPHDHRDVVVAAALVGQVDQRARARRRVGQRGDDSRISVSSTRFDEAVGAEHEGVARLQVEAHHVDLRRPARSPPSG